MKTSRTALGLVAILLTAATLLGQTAPTAKERQAKALAILKGDALPKDKADACRELALVGDKDAVPVLAALLADEKMNHMARYALEPIPDPSVDDALRDALGKLKGRPLVGVIGSIGVRRDAKATDAIGKLLADPDAEVVQAAARTLGKIGSADAAKAIEAALANAAADNRLALYEGLFRCADTLATTQREAAMGIYDRIRASTGLPHQVRAAAIRGAILVRQKDGLPLLLETLRDKDFAVAAIAIRTSMELAGPEVTQALAAELPKLSPDAQYIAIQALGNRGDAAAIPALQAAATSGPNNLRLAAIRSLIQIGNGASMPLIIELATGADAELAAVAQAGMASFSGKDADAAVIALLASPQAKLRGIAIDLIAQRRITSALPELLKTGEDKDETVRLAGLRALGEIATLAELPTMLKILNAAKSPAELQAAEASLSSFCARQASMEITKVTISKAVFGNLTDGPSGDVTAKLSELVKTGTLSVEASVANFGDTAPGIVKSLHVEYIANGQPGSKTVAEGETLTITAPPKAGIGADAICEALVKAELQPKLAMLRVLRSVGGSKALDTVRVSCGDSSPAVKETALRVLCEWQSPDALGDLEKLAKTSTDAKVKVLAVRGYIRLLRIQDMPLDKKFAAIKDSAALITRNDEKKLLLAALGDVPTTESLAMVMSNMDNPELKDEASLAAIAIGEKLVTKRPAEVKAAMQQIIKSTGNASIKKKANAVIRGLK